MLSFVLTKCSHFFYCSHFWYILLEDWKCESGKCEMIEESFQCSVTKQSESELVSLYKLLKVNADLSFIRRIRKQFL